MPRARIECGIVQRKGLELEGVAGHTRHLLAAERSLHDLDRPVFEHLECGKHEQEAEP